MIADNHDSVQGNSTVQSSDSDKLPGNFVMFVMVILAHLKKNVPWLCLNFFECKETPIGKIQMYKNTENIPLRRI